MADIAITTATEVRLVYDQGAELFNYVCGVTITRGQVVYVTSAGTIALADADDAGKLQAIGIAMKGGVVGDAISVLKKGHVYGFTTNLPAIGAHVWLSNTPGALSDAAAGVAQPVGQVMCLTDKPNYTEILYVDFGWSTLYA